MLKRVYLTDIASDLLGVDAATLRKRAGRGKVKAFGPRSRPNPLREWLFDADDVDAQAQKTTTEGALWIADQVVVATQAAVPEAPMSTEASEMGSLVARYRDQLDVVTAEAAVEREARLVAERRLVEEERDNALRELRRVERAFRSLAAGVVSDDVEAGPS